MAGTGCVAGFGRNGKLRAIALRAPIAAAVLGFNEDSILAVEQLQLPEGMSPRVWRVQVGYARNHTVQDRVAAGAPAGRVAFAVEQYRTAVVENAAIKSQSRLARAVSVPSVLAFEADAAQLALDLFSYYSPIRKLLRVQVPLSGLSLELGEALTLTHPRFGLANGSLGRVVGYALDLGRGVVDLEVFT